MANVTLNHIYKVYDNGVKAVNDFNLDINDKEFIVFVGPSGCGKSTTLRMIAGLEDITSGELKIDEKIVNDTPPKDRDIAMVFQNYALYPHMTVYENMAFGLKLKKIPKEIIHEKIIEASKILGITEYLDRKPKAMSGGQRQRVALGRAILRNPKVFLLDEPLSNLDAKLRTQMRAEILKLHKKINTTFIYVTHDQVEAMTMGTRIVVMKDGILQQVDTPKNLYKYPINKFVAGFIGTPQMNFFNCVINKQDENYIISLEQSDVSLKIAPKYILKADKKYFDGKTKIILGIRCEHLKIYEGENNIDNKIPVKVSHLEELGDETLVYGDINLENEEFNDIDSRIIIKTSADKVYQTGDIINVGIDFRYAHFFDYTSEKTIIPRVPTDNITNAFIVNKKIKIFSTDFDLPPAFQDLKEQRYKVVIPTSAIINGNDIKCKVVNLEKIENFLLLYLKIGENIIFMKTNDDINVGDDINISIDFKQLTFYIDDNIVKKPLPMTNKINTGFIKEKENKIVNFKLKITNKSFVVPNNISEKVLSALSLKAFNTNYILSFNPYEYELTRDGLESKIIDVLDYGKERFIKIKLEDKIIYLCDKYNLKNNDKIIFMPDLNKISLKESNLNIKII